ncbi:MAG TPA: hypothetical protein PL110_02030 [Candidatus Eremiobacteraeota bacterium]|nr:MAG: hypothetical protein BWY64_00786 [bacterium ADurb.Bin363]HPZ06869.1 hypothetical protein [Candidatus Eremiobacteraeota bacterium]
MKINKNNVQIQNKNAIIKEANTESEEQVILGSTYKIPDFLQKPPVITIGEGAVTKLDHPKSREEFTEGGFFKAIPGKYTIDGSLGGTIFPDSCGKIEHMAFQFGNKEFEKNLWSSTREAVLNVYKTLFRHMSPETQFTIVVPDKESMEICQNLVKECKPENPQRIHIVDSKAPHGFSIWIRDSMIPVRDGEGKGKLIIQDRTYWPGEDDAMIPAIIDDHHDDISSVRNPVLRIDGGNILSNKTHAFVGIDSATQTTDLLKELAENTENKKEIVRFYETKSGKEVIEEGTPEGNQVTIEQMWTDIALMVFESEFNKKIYIVGNDDPSTPDIIETQPVFHIDMCTTPIGEDTFLVGDPSMAIELLRSLPPEEVKRLNEKVSKKCGFKETSDIIGKIMDANKAKEFQVNFDNLAKELKEKGYNVHRMPYLSGLRTTWSLPYLTYNNCIQENYIDDSGEHIKKVYLPLYGMDPLDEIAVETYEKFGYEVIPLDMSAITILEGAIRCSAYPIDRSREK